MGRRKHARQRGWDLLPWISLESGKAFIGYSTERLEFRRSLREALLELIRLTSSAKNMFVESISEFTSDQGRQVCYAFNLVVLVYMRVYLLFHQFKVICGSIYLLNQRRSFSEKGLEQYALESDLKNILCHSYKLHRNGCPFQFWYSLVLIHCFSSLSPAISPNSTFPRSGSAF